MSLILCPECGTKISDRARACPCCGFQSDNPLLPISEQDIYEPTPFFSFEIEEWDPDNSFEYTVSYESNRRLADFFAKWDNVKIHIPAIAEVLEAMAKKDHIMAAKMDGYIKDLIDKGVYRFVLDKNGEILPTIRDSNSFVKQVRLEEIEMTPDAIAALSNLSTHIAIAQVMNEVRSIQASINELHIELQNDRLALAESARDKLKQARLIQDSKLRQSAVLDVVHSSTDTKRRLMREFNRELKYIKENSYNYGILASLSGNNNKNMDGKAVEAFQNLIYITNLVRTECEGYTIIDEFEPCKECIAEFKSFILDNELNDRNTLLTINEHLAQKRIDIVDSFEITAENILAFDLSSDLIEGELQQLLPVKDNRNERIENV